VIEPADRDEEVRLRVEETFDGVRVGVKLVLAVAVVEVEAVRRLVFMWFLCEGGDVVGDGSFNWAGFRASPGEKTEAAVMMPCLLFADCE
jgi:hypothetical protein